MSSVWSTEQPNPFEAGAQGGVTRESRRQRRLTEAHEDLPELSPMLASLSRKSPIQFGNIHPGDERIDHPDLTLPTSSRDQQDISLNPKAEPLSGIAIPPMRTEELEPAHSTHVSAFKARAPSADQPAPSISGKTTIPNFAASFNFKPTEEENLESKGKEKEKARVARLIPLGTPLLKDVPESFPHIRREYVRILTNELPLSNKDYDIDMEGLVKRYHGAIEHAQQGLGRSFPQEQNGRRRELEEDPLGAVSAKMNQMFNEVEVYEFPDGKKAYRVSRRKWNGLVEGLKEAGEICKELFHLAGKEAPLLPLWGKEKDHIQHFWSLNDFEILSVAARCEIESYMLRIRDIVYWDHQRRQGGKPSLIKRAKEESKEEELPIKIPAASVQQQYNESSVKTEDVNTYGSKESKEKPSYTSNSTNPFRDPLSDFVQKEIPTRSITPQVNRKTMILQPTGNVKEESSSTVFQSLFQSTFPSQGNEQEERNSRDYGNGGQVRFKESPSGSDSSSSDSDSDSDRGGSGRNFRRKKVRSKREVKREELGTSREKEELKDEPRFDHRLKPEVIPTWDGDTDELARWIVKVNSLASLSRIVWRQLGHMVPTRLRGSAERWYYSQHPRLRKKLEENWDSLREGISNYYMNRAYLDKQKIRANRASYRDAGHAKELPSEYFIRKLELLQQVYDYNEREMISEIMSGAPSTWIPILTPHLYRKVSELQTTLKFHEEMLMQLDVPRYNPAQNFMNHSTGQRQYSRNPFNNYKGPSQARVNLVGWSEAVKNPPFPKDDANVSKRGTPVSKGGRPCRHCGSGNHWDYECKYSRKGERKVRTNMVAVSEEDYRAQEDYDDLYYNLESEDETASDFQ